MRAIARFSLASVFFVAAISGKPVHKANILLTLMQSRILWMHSGKRNGTAPPQVLRLSCRRARLHRRVGSTEGGPPPPQPADPRPRARGRDDAVCEDQPPGRAHGC